jgi:membrane-associated phospholipid phosphatase
VYNEGCAFVNCEGPGYLLQEHSMDTLIQNGIALVLAIQGMGDWLIAPMRFFSFLGTEEFFFMGLPFIYWSVDSALGLRVGLILATGNIIKFIGKLAFAGPRPYWVTSQVKAYWLETSFGAPSGHALDAFTVWGTIAAYLRKAWIWILAGLLIFFIGFSRLVLGVHFLHDVIIGWLIGGLLLWVFNRFWNPAAAWLNRQTVARRLLIVFLASLIAIAAGLGIAVPMNDDVLPASWVANARLAGTEDLDPVEPSGIITSAGTLFGLAAGAVWMKQLGGYQASGPVSKRILRYLIGLIGVVLFWFGLGEIFPRGDELISYLLRYVRYAMVGFWVSGGAPWLFFRIRLAEPPQSG